MSLDDGRYFFGYVAPGRYLIRFSRVGYSLYEDSAPAGTGTRGSASAKARGTRAAITR
jgi:hypothetical protein